MTKKQHRQVKLPRGAHLSARFALAESENENPADMPFIAAYLRG